MLPAPGEASVNSVRVWGAAEFFQEGPIIPEITIEEKIKLSCTALDDESLGIQDRYKQVSPGCGRSIGNLPGLCWFPRGVALLALRPFAL